MLKVINTKTRDRVQLTGLWDFCLDPDDVGEKEAWFAHFLPEAVKMAVPSSFNDIFTQNSIHDYVGVFWYQRRVKIPYGWAGGRIVLRFESVTHRAAVWVNNALCVRHEGGYLPFEADVTDFAAEGGFLRITVRGENLLSFESIPPGMVKDSGHGKKQLYWHDFFNYAGIHRSVWLYRTPDTWLEDADVVTDCDKKVGIVHYRTVWQRKRERDEVKAYLLDSTGKCVASCDGGEGELRIENARFWEPGDGYLYTCIWELSRDGSLVDSYGLRVGIRTILIEGNKFLINGKPFFFKGFGMHEDSIVLGKAHNDSYMLCDFARMKWVGANSFRTSHYPYAEEVLDYADEQGFVVIDETAAVGLNLLGAQIFPGEEMSTFSENTINDKTRTVHEKQLRELIQRDKNHPCVAVWSLANEPESQTEGASRYFEPLFWAARQADPSRRPVGFVNMMLGTPGTCQVARFADLIMLNRYYGWYVDTADLDVAGERLKKELEEWQEQGKPILLTEYGADAVEGLHQLYGGPWSEEFQVKLLERYHQVLRTMEGVVGEQVWNFADFATAPGIMRVGGNRKGVFTRQREPKAAAYMLREYWKNR